MKTYWYEGDSCQVRQTFKKPQFRPHFPQFIACRFVPFSCWFEQKKTGKIPIFTPLLPSLYFQELIWTLQTDIQLPLTISLTICKLFHNSRFTTRARRPSAAGQTALLQICPPAHNFLTPPPPSFLPFCFSLCKANTHLLSHYLIDLLQCCCSACAHSFIFWVVRKLAFWVNEVIGVAFPDLEMFALLCRYH